ncbi:methyltransferase domain-containing protein [Exophiala viscosa]|uniref:Methyltransferase domain-containing protein n=1 Tax=Exophiala viscosa TaxID=2486360 RepID=A0AAN6IF44_9EURO|nr:methyltransferase domain-containing protein [Exophiala viscosa]KAI1619223.1 methyltransferase domain-containing protein [Exophiala viscosa]
MSPGESKPHKRPSLPLRPDWTSEDEYVQSVLSFATTSDLFRNLCGGVHILDFLTREPDLYTHVLPQDWRDWFDLVTIDDVLDLLLREELSKFENATIQQNGIPIPPQTLLDYVHTVRKHCLQRRFQPVLDNIPDMPRHISVGMKTKKVHEVTNFAAYVDKLSTEVSERLQEPISVVDFGSGQNYLGRTLASPPYNKHVIAIERKHHNIAGAQAMDVHAKLAKREKIMRNKKEWKRQLALNNGMPTPPPEEQTDDSPIPDVILASNDLTNGFDSSKGSMTYIEHDVKDGHLENILYPDEDNNDDEHPPEHTTKTPNNGNTTESVSSRPKAMVVSLHSCGNLSHHGLRSLTLNPSISAVAIIGCCYNLLTERLGPASYKLPQLRPNHPRLEATGSAYDPHGFPMSRTLETFTYPTSESEGQADFPHASGAGVKLNITARMMAVQAPYNWGPEDSEAFFRRHFYRTLLQRILLDLGVVHQYPGDPESLAGGSITGRDTNGTPLIVGSLRKACFTSFRAYVHGALAKLVNDPTDGDMIREKTRDLTDDVIDEYEHKWGYAKKNLAVIWSLMAFSAGVVESIIVTDRWLFLREQDCVKDAWVDIVFDYKQSPRNFVVVGIKKEMDDVSPPT